ncbi:BTAD domain-containing putative transcriptional regulator [Amycolatopsis sp. NPDC059021]|uniref:AfsR/SARP family transcriptional regulator n=1 Tax=Amycolatopsis sp. NPDC059021 TaxID=3346704 RepID=UPI00366DE55F
MRFEVLGTIGAGQAPIHGRLRRTLLGLLLAGAGTTVRAEVLTGALWDCGPDPRAPRKLHWHVHKLRQDLPEPGRLSRRPGGYRLTVLPGELDAERFESAAIRAQELTDPAERAALLRQGLALWQGTPYEGFEVPMLLGEASRLAERKLSMLEELHAAELELGWHTAAAVELGGLVRRYPRRERLYYLLMLALCRGGRQSEALDVYRRARRVSLGQAGLEPGPALRELERRILAGEDSEKARTLTRLS